MSCALNNAKPCPLAWWGVSGSVQDSLEWQGAIRRHVRDTKLWKREPTFEVRSKKQGSDLFWTRVWCIPGFGAENKSALFLDFLLLSAVLRVRGRFQNPRQTLVRTKLRLKYFPKGVFWTRVRSGPGKPNQRKVSSWTFRRGIPEQKFDMWIVLVFLRKNTRIHKKGRNSWTFRFGPFFGLPERLLKGFFFQKGPFSRDSRDFRDVRSSREPLNVEKQLRESDYHCGRNYS